MSETHAELVAKYSPLVARGDDAIGEYVARRSAVFDAEYSRRQRAADDAHASFDQVAALVAAHKAEEAVSDNTKSIPLGRNHFDAILRYEGREAYEAAAYELYKSDPKLHAQLGLPKPRPVGA